MEKPYTFHPLTEMLADFAKKYRGLPVNIRAALMRICMAAIYLRGSVASMFSSAPWGWFIGHLPSPANGTMEGAVLGGPVQMVEPDEFLIEEILQKNHIKGSKLKEIRQHIGEVPVIKPEVVNNSIRTTFYSSYLIYRIFNLQNTLMSVNIMNTSHTSQNIYITLKQWAVTIVI
jgi:hypothetical protein